MVAQHNLSAMNANRMLGVTQGSLTKSTEKAHDAGIKGKLVDKGGATVTFELEKPLEDGDKINIAVRQSL